MDVFLEEIARSILLGIKDSLPDELAAVAQESTALDVAFYTQLGKPVEPTPLHPPAEYLVGHHPSLLERELSEFPNVTVMAYQQTPMGDRGADFYETQVNRVYVEAFAQDPDESRINRIAWRYAKALHRVITKDRNLSRLVKDLDTPPSVQVSNAAARRITDMSDEITYVQGCRLDYALEMDVAWS